MGDKRSAYFFEMLKNYKVLFKKSQLPAVKTAKDDALCSLRDDYMRKLGQAITTAQLRKNIQNLKNDVKKKSDVRATGNKPIMLIEWERELLDLLERDCNPVFSKIPGAIDVSFGVEKDATPNFDITIDESQGKSEKHDCIDGRKETQKAKKIKLSDETEETQNLSLPELQRLVLLRQLKLVNMKIREREQKKEENLGTIKALKVEDKNGEEYPIEILDEMYCTEM